MAFKSASEYWAARKAREAARLEIKRQAITVAWLNRKCQVCGGPVTTNGYCVADITLCNRAYTD